MISFHALASGPFESLFFVTFARGSQGLRYRVAGDRNEAIDDRGRTKQNWVFLLEGYRSASLDRDVGGHQVRHEL